MHHTFLTLALIATSRFGRSIAGRRYAWAVLHRIPFQMLPCTLLNPTHINKHFSHLLVMIAVAPATILIYNSICLSFCGKNSSGYFPYSPYYCGTFFSSCDGLKFCNLSHDKTNVPCGRQTHVNRQSYQTRADADYVLSLHDIFRTSQLTRCYIRTTQVLKDCKPPPMDGW